MKVGFAGKVAHAFLDSKLTPLFIAASLGLGALALLATPREEEPQIRVPMVDVMVAWPGAEPAEVENRIVAPIERILWGVPGVEHIYSVVPPRPGDDHRPVQGQRVERGQPRQGLRAAVGRGLDHAPGRPAADHRAALDRRRALPDPHPVGEGLVERPAAAARRRAGPGALGGPRGEPRPADRRPAPRRARGAGPRPHGRRRHQLDAAHRRPAGGLRPAGRRHRRAGQPRDPSRGRAALPQLRGDRPRRGRPLAGPPRLRLPGGPRRGRARRGDRRRLLLPGPGRDLGGGPRGQRARGGHHRPRRSAPGRTRPSSPRTSCARSRTCGPASSPPRSAWT